MLKIIKKITKTSIVQNISLLTLGTILSMAISLLFEPLLKRLYEPEDFGKLSLFLKLFNTLIILYSGCYEMAIIVSKKDREAREIIRGNVLLNIIFTILFEIIFLILLYLKIISYEYFIIIFLPITALFYSIGLSFNNYMLRKEKYNKIFINKLVKKIGEIIVQISGKIIFNLNIGLIIANIFGNICFMIYNFKISQIKIFFKIDRIRNIWKKYIEFPKYYLLPQLYNTLSFSLLDFSIFAKFSLREVGYLELTNKILQIPSALLGESISNVLLQTSSKKVNSNESIKKDFFYGFLFLGMIGVIYFVIIFFLGPNLFKLVFGLKWEKSGIYAKYLIGYIIGTFIASSLSAILLALKKIKENSIWQVLKTSVILVLCLFKYQSVESFIKIYTICNVILYIIYIVIIIFKVFEYEKEIIKYNSKKEKK
ncbi:oligosaccharide flippase family protein [Fusobacterium periodonticum]|uniref:lipopolysaccharide biosynthesis protein n=1 Tax=Fusobacterium periodonticum TaxID=860 RepID=UPI0028CFF0FE|nr:oligosaccharide flippase family protein [Fusobacterium periodonticum]